jgi:hypothetical protein
VNSQKTTENNGNGLEGSPDTYGGEDYSDQENCSDVINLKIGMNVFGKK